MSTYLVFMDGKEIVGMVPVEEDYEPEAELIATANTLGHRLGLLENFEAPPDNPISPDVLDHGDTLLWAIKQSHYIELDEEAGEEDAS